MRAFSVAIGSGSLAALFLFLMMPLSEVLIAVIVRVRSCRNEKSDIASEQHDIARKDDDSNLVKGLAGYLYHGTCIDVQ
jgi:hypothetical protein